MFLFKRKYYTGNFTFLTLRILELFIRKAHKMFVYKHAETSIVSIVFCLYTLKSRLIFKKNTKRTGE